LYNGGAAKQFSVQDEVGLCFSNQAWSLIRGSLIKVSFLGSDELLGWYDGQSFIDKTSTYSARR
jgi:hypothetical protein